ncbi:ATP-binding cassette sub- G member 3 [Orobanche gracilis]
MVPHGSIMALQEGPFLKSKGRASCFTKIAVLTWRSLLIMSREWKYYWLRLFLYMFVSLCIATLFYGLGHSLSSVETRVGAIFIFVSFTSLLSIAGVPAQLNEIKIYSCEVKNRHSGTLVFLTGQLLSSIPFLLLLSISSSLVFYFLVGLRDVFGSFLYFALDFFMCLLVNEGLVLLAASVCRNTFWSILILVTLHMVMMLSAGYFRIRSALPRPVWMYPLSYITFHTYSIQGLLENEYMGASFPVGEERSISGYGAVESAYDISADSNSKWAFTSSAKMSHVNTLAIYIDKKRSTTYYPKGLGVGDKGRNGLSINLLQPRKKKRRLGVPSCSPSPRMLYVPRA